MALLSSIFPCNVVVEILAYLPARSLARFRCVSKSWRSLLSEKYFLTMWLNRSGTSLLVVPLEWDIRDKCSLVFENVSIGRENLRLPVGNDWVSLSVVGSSSDGALICLTGLSFVRRNASKLAVILWSPFTGEVKTLSHHDYIYCHERPLCSQSQAQGYSSGCCVRYHVHGFGYAPNARDYKIVRITYSRGVARRAVASIRPSNVEVYSLGRDKWTSLGRPNFTRTIRGNSRAFINGAAHWLAAPREDAPYNSIVAFGMEEESFKQVMPLPRKRNISQYSLHSRGKATLAVSCGSLALIAFTVWDREVCGIWVMKEYGVASSWTKQHHIVLPIGLTCRAALGLTGNGKIVLRMVDESLVCCDLGDKQISEVGIGGEGTESSFDVIDLGRGNPSLRNQVGGGSPLTMLNPDKELGCITFTELRICFSKIDDHLSFL